MRKLLLVVGLLGAGVAGYFLARDYIEVEKFDSIKEKLPKVDLNRVKTLVEQKDEVIDKIISLSTTITETAKELIEKGSDYAQEKKQYLLDLIEETKKTIQEEKEKLKEIRERLDKTDSEVV